MDFGLFLHSQKTLGLVAQAVEQLTLNQRVQIDGE